MLNNSITIGLAIISLVCVYLIWESFKQSAKIRYLESSIHETIQTVQGLVNNSLALPPLQRNDANHNYHPAPINNIIKNNTQDQVQTKEKQSVSSSEKQAVDNLFENDELESVTEEVENDNQDLEPFEMTEELKSKINNLTFNEPENTESEDGEEMEEVEDIENIEDVEEMEEYQSEGMEDMNEVENVENIEDIDDIENIDDIQDISEVKDNIVETPKEVEVSEVNQEKSVEVQELPEDDHQSSESTESGDEDYIKNPNLLNGMSLKELREIAEKQNLGYRGTKEQLITKIKRNIMMASN
jgi:hypothetical protein